MSEGGISSKGTEFLRRTRASLQEKGIAHFLRSIAYESARLMGSLICVAYFKAFKSSKRFVFQGREYSYLYHRYGKTWRNERAVEVPLAMGFVQESGAKRILEVGNVLRNYHDLRHDVVDKYEKAYGVMNVDIVDYHPSDKYDLIVSISTIEHVGWDETPKEPAKVLRALDNLRSLLAPGGRIVITFPMGQNPELDRYIKEGMLGLSEAFYLRRLTNDNRWIQSDWEEVKDAKYGYPFRSTNAVVIGIIDGSASS